MGINAIKAIIRAEMDPILSPNELSWKNMPKLMTARSKSGKKIVAITVKGSLYTGISK